MANPTQLNLLKPQPKEYGGTLRTKRKNRGERPLATQNSMHLVLRSSHARGEWSFKNPLHRRRIAAILEKFSHKYGVRLISRANVGNHLHIHMQLTQRSGYKPFIRAITSSIAMAVTGQSRWKRFKIRFWDWRPYTRVVISHRAFAMLEKYIRINQLEGQGYSRTAARAVMIWPWMAQAKNSS